VSRDHENLIEKTVWQYENFILGNGVGGGGRGGRNLEDWTIGRLEKLEAERNKSKNTIQYPLVGCFLKNRETHC